MITNIKNGLDVSTVVQAAVSQHGATHEDLIPILLSVNEQLGYLPTEALSEISHSLRLAHSEIMAVASFYRMLSTEPRGKHVIQFCESAPCHVMGGRQVLRALQEELNLEPGQTSADGQWTLLEISCPGICGVGPVMMIDEDVYGNLVPERLSEILAKYRE